MAEFDRYASTYKEAHDRNLGLLGESSAAFDEHKITELRAFLAVQGREGQPLSLLDYGCGIGKAHAHVRRLLPQVSYRGIDMSEESIRSANAQPGAAPGTFALFDGARIPAEAGSYDVVFLSGVVHHIPPAQRPGVMSELRRVLKPGGFVMIFEHNPNNPATLYIVKNCEFDDDAHLIRRSALTGLLRGAGFDRVLGRFVIFVPTGLRKRFPVLERALAWLPFGAQYWVAAFK